MRQQPAIFSAPGQRPATPCGWTWQTQLGKTPVAAAVGGLCRVGSFVWTFRHRSIYNYIYTLPFRREISSVWRLEVQGILYIYIHNYIYIFIYSIYIYIFYIYTYYIHNYIIYIYLRPTISQLHIIYIIHIIYIHIIYIHIIYIYISAYINTCVPPYPSYTVPRQKAKPQSELSPDRRQNHQERLAFTSGCDTSPLLVKGDTIHHLS